MPPANELLLPEDTPLASRRGLDESQSCVAHADLPIILLEARPTGEFGNRKSDGVGEAASESAYAALGVRDVDQGLEALSRSDHVVR